MAEARPLAVIVADVCKYLEASIKRPMSKSVYERGRVIAGCEQIARGQADTNNYEELVKMQGNLWKSLTAGQKFLCAIYYVPGAKDIRDDEVSTFAFGVIAFSAIARLNYQILNILRREGSDMFKTAPNDLAYCMRHKIAPTAETATKPVLSFSTYELITSLRMVCDAMIVGEYSDELLYFVKLLEFRASELIYTNGGAEIFDAVDYLRKLPGGGFCCNQKFVILVWATIFDIRNYLIMARGLLGKDNNVDAPVVSPGEEFDYASMNAIVPVIRHACSITQAMEPSASILQCLVKLNLRPGDAILYALDNPGASKSEDGIVADMLGDAQFAPIARRLGITAVTGITEVLNNANPDFSEEPLTFGLCMFDFLDMRTQNTAASRWGWLYSYRSVDVRAGPEAVRQRCREVPLVCQVGTGGRWQLVYIDRVYWFNSFMFAYLAWLKLLNLEQRRKHSLRGEFYIAYNTDAYRECIEAVRAAGIDVPPPDPRQRRTMVKMTGREVEDFIRSGSW